MTVIPIIIILLIIVVINIVSLFLYSVQSHLLYPK